MEDLLIIIKIVIILTAISFAIYSWIYMTQVRKIDKQLGYILPRFINRVITFLVIFPMALLLVAIFIVFVEIEI